MKKTLALLALLTIALATTSTAAEERHVRSTLVPIDGSGVTGFVQLTQLPHGGSNLVVVANGLHPGTLYASFYYESSDCTADHDLFGTFTADAAGNGEIHGKIDDDLDEVGSVSVRLGPDYGTLLACATIH